MAVDSRPVGAFGWGQKTPLFGAMPSYWPLQDLNEINPNYLVVAVGPISSDYDRACEVFYQLYGGQVDYGEAHAQTCGHLRFGVTHEAMHPNWGEDNPVHLLGHSCGATTSIELYQLLCKDHFGVGSSHKWVKSIICICGPLTGSTLSNLLGIGPNSKLALLSGGHLVGSSFALFWKLQECYLPSLKALYDLKMEHWNNMTSWRDVFSPDSSLFTSHDILWDDIVPATRLQKNQALIEMDKVHLFSVVTCAKDYPHVLSGMTWFLSLFTNRMNKHEPFHGFDSRHWANNDGVVNTYSQVYPRVKCGRFTPVPGACPPLPSHTPASGSHLPMPGNYTPVPGNHPVVPTSYTPGSGGHLSFSGSDSPAVGTWSPAESHISFDLDAQDGASAPLKGRWYTYHVEKNHFCGTFLDADARDLYCNLFKLVNKYSNIVPEEDDSDTMA
ncbi:hypothetical protein SDRG_16088 [Saprolegnia diclina VS20]|uniref:Lipase-like C-terminal domain-containing protein n=1 Tax=Saprolegnia diclina (strain VS20) TaxID=1156394 RepID=T0PL26_SAPDV|nr:hypothetical protein SDRG_16088 [Saprolegnia diclina VS20]EQC26069.1 hypothetical protein SDRG_16088 [Saprolegnia diclina VS20]|eukprot:XP_008620506.1 hypothetical protein SDRG_16088 [Saprolegnia diclina VS20]